MYDGNKTDRLARKKKKGIVGLGGARPLSLIIPKERIQKQKQKRVLRMYGKYVDNAKVCTYQDAPPTPPHTLGRKKKYPTYNFS